MSNELVGGFEGRKAVGNRHYRAMDVTAAADEWVRLRTSDDREQYKEAAWADLPSEFWLDALVVCRRSPPCQGSASTRTPTSSEVRPLASWSSRT